MKAGLVAAWPAWRMFVSGTQPVNAVNKSASFCFTSWTPGPEYTVDVPTGPASSVTPGGIGELTIYASGDGNVSFYTALAFGGFGRTFAGTAGEMLFTNLRLYTGRAIGSIIGWILKWDNFQLIVDGSAVASYGAGVIANSLLTPAGIPLIGIPPTFVCECNGDVPPTNNPAVADWIGASNLQTLSGGWEWQWQAGTWVSAPLYYHPVAAPGGPALPTISAPNTGSISMTCNGYLIDTGTTNIDGSELFEAGNQTASLTALPGLTKVVRRLNVYDYHKNLYSIQDYGALILRAGIPMARCEGSASGASPVYDTFFPQSDEILSHVKNAFHPLENPFTYRTYAPYIAFNTDTVSANPWISGGGGPTPGTVITSAESALLGASGTAIGMKTGLNVATESDKLNALANYINYNANPHWSTDYYFPPDTETDSNAWPVDGNLTTYPDDDPPWTTDGYWVPGRMQWVHNSALPGDENTQTRTDLITAPLSDGTLQITVYPSPPGPNTSPWGITRFETDAVSFATTSVPASSGDGWSVSGGAASYGASIVITPNPGATKVVLTYELGSFVRSPYMAMMIAKQVVLGWAGSGISAARVNFVGLDGKRAVLANAPGTATWPLKQFGSGYAGTWVQDYGVGYTVDQGRDVNRMGLSLDVMADPLTVHSFGLTGGLTAAKLEFVFDISNPSDTIAVDYPEFIPSTDPPATIYENGFQAAILWPNGPGVRFGNWGFWDYRLNQWTSVPGPFTFGYKPSPMDWIGQKNCMFLGLESKTGLDSKLASWFDTDEGQAEIDVVSDTMAIPITVPSGGSAELTALIVNDWREVPPLCQFPLPPRKTDMTLDYTGVPIQESWSYAQEPRYFIAPTRAPLLTGGSGNSSSTAYALSNWGVSKFSGAVDNTEDLNSLIRNGSYVRFGEVSPWHGYFCVIPPGFASPVYLKEDRRGRLHLVWLDGGDVWYGRAAFATPGTTGMASNEQVTNYGDVIQAAHAIDHSKGIVWLAFTRKDLMSGAVSLWWGYSTSSGNDFWTFTELVGGGMMGFPWVERSGGRGVTWFQYDSGTSGPGKQFGQRAEQAGLALGSTFTFKDDTGTPISVADGGWSNVDEAKERPRRLVWCPTIEGETAASVWYSTDRGKTWIRES